MSTLYSILEAGAALTLERGVQLHVQVHQVSSAYTFLVDMNVSYLGNAMLPCGTVSITLLRTSSSSS